jgi:F-type H+-transporting ATPase subunit epsilon
MSRKIYCTILTPERYLFEGEVDFAVVQAHDGERGFLLRHIPFITKLGSGEVRLMKGQSTEHLMLEGGLVEIIDNNLTILAEKGYLKQELDPETLQKELDEIMEIKKTKKVDAITEEGYTYLETERNLKIKLKVSQR